MQNILHSDEGNGGARAGLRTIVAQALERNSRLLAQLAGSPVVELARRLEPELLQQLAFWRLFQSSAQRDRARSACERLEQVQQQVEAAVVGLDAADGLEDALDSGNKAAAQTLGIVLQRLERQIDQNQPRRSIEQLLLLDAVALRELAADVVDTTQQEELEAALSSTLLLDAQSAQQRCQQALLEDGRADSLHARRRLQIHLAQMELFAPFLSEESRRNLWYRRRLSHVLRRSAGYSVIEEELEQLLVTRQVTPREHQTLLGALSRGQSNLGPRATRLYRRGFPASAQADTVAGAEHLRAANADRLEDRNLEEGTAGIDPEQRDLALL